LSRQEPGLKRFDIFQTKNKPFEITIVEVYDDEAAFQFHTKQPNFQGWTTFKDSGGANEDVPILVSRMTGHDYTYENNAGY